MNIGLFVFRLSLSPTMIKGRHTYGFERTSRCSCVADKNDILRHPLIDSSSLLFSTNSERISMNEWVKFSAPFRFQLMMGINLETEQFIC